MKLVDQLVLSSLVSVAHYSITTFVNKTMVGEAESTRDGLFDATLIFGSNGNCFLNVMASNNQMEWVMYCLIDFDGLVLCLIHTCTLNCCTSYIIHFLNGFNSVHL